MSKKNKHFKNDRAKERENIQLARYQAGDYGPVKEESKSLDNNTTKEITNQITEKTMKTRKFISIDQLNTEEYNALKNLQTIGLDIAETIRIISDVKEANDHKTKLLELLDKNIDQQTALFTVETETVVKTDATQQQLNLNNEKKEDKAGKVVTHPETAKKEEEKAKNEQKSVKDAETTSTSSTKDEKNAASTAATQDAQEKKPETKSEDSIAETNAAIQNMIVDAFNDNNGDVPKTVRKEMVAMLQKGYPKDHIVNDPKQGVGNAWKVINEMVEAGIAELSEPAETTDETATTAPESTTPEATAAEAEELKSTKELPDVGQAAATTEDVDALVNEEAGEETATEENNTTPVEEGGKTVEETEEQKTKREEVNAPANTYIPTQDDMSKAGKSIDYSKLETELNSTKSFDEVKKVLLSYIPFCTADNVKNEVKARSFKAIKKVRNAIDNGVNVFGNNNQINETLGVFLKSEVEKLKKSA